MKRQKNRNKPARKSSPKLKSAPEAPVTSRRAFLGTLRNSALVGAGLLGGGWYLIEDARAHCREGDLARIGNGVPSVVQIHDPECPRCRALQKEARAALSDFDEEELQYLVANIRTDEGRELANTHGVGHVTLLLFDAQGRRKHILRGHNQAEALKQVFRIHLNSGKRGGTS